jgi:hypothetical protein
MAEILNFEMKKKGIIKKSVFQVARVLWLDERPAHRTH